MNTALFKKLTVTLLLGIALFAMTNIAEAAVSIDPTLHPDYAPQGWSELNTEGAENQFGSTAVNYLIADIAVVLLQIAGVLAIAFIVMNGFNYVKAFGRDEELQKAKKGITWAIVGLIVVILSYAIVQNIIKITLSVDEEDSAEGEPATSAHYLSQKQILTDSAGKHWEIILN